MKKSLNLIRVMVAFSILALTQAVYAASDSVGKSLMNINEAKEDIEDLLVGWTIVDVTSIPAHAIVAIEQEFIRTRTEVENEVKNLIKERMSAKKDNKGNKIDTKMANVKIPSTDANEAVAQGIIGKGLIKDDESEVEKDGQETTMDLTMQQQANWTSSAGSKRAREAYAEKRRYIEQEQLIRVLGQISEMRKNIAGKLLCGQDGPIKHLNANYDESDAKKDLDPNGKSAKSKEDVALDEYNTVEKTNDYNQVFRQYAFNGLVYDQMLSLEQQVMGLRLQVVAGQKAQNMDPLTDKLEVNAQEDEASAEK